jgi:hypothetical protein
MFHTALSGRVFVQYVNMPFTEDSYTSGKKKIITFVLENVIK